MIHEMKNGSLEKKGSPSRGHKLKVYQKSNSPVEHR